MSVIMPVSVNGDLPSGPVDQSVPCVAANNDNQRQGYTGGYVQPVLSEVVEPTSLQGQPQHIPNSLSAPSVQRAARPILGAAANHGLPLGNLEKTATAVMPSDSAPGKGVVSGNVPITVDIVPQPARPPSNSENIPNGRHWPPPALDSPNCMRSVNVPPPSSSPAMMQQPLPADAVTANPSHHFVAPPYCFVTPTAVPTTTVPTGPSASVSTAIAQTAGNPAPGASLCTAGCCQCGQCQPAAPPIGAYAYAYPPFMFPNAGPFLPGFGYAIPGLPFPPPPSLPPVSYSSTYTQSSDLVYNNQPVFTFMHQFQRPPPPPSQAPMPPPNAGRGLPLKHSPVVTVPFNPMMPPPSAHVANLSGRRSSTKNLNCFNCGLIGHQASVCPEPLMSSSAQTGTSRPHNIVDFLSLFERCYC